MLFVDIIAEVSLGSSTVQMRTPGATTYVVLLSPTSSSHLQIIKALIDKKYGFFPSKELLFQNEVG